MPTELTDDEVFGAPAGPAAIAELSDADVFGATPNAAPATELSDADVFGASVAPAPAAAPSLTQRIFGAQEQAGLAIESGDMGPVLLRTSPETQAAAKQPAITLPKTEILQEDSTLRKAGGAAWNTVAGFVEGVTSPEGIEGLVNPFVGGAQFASVVPHVFNQLLEANKTPANSPERWQAASNFIATLALPVAVHGAFKLAGPKRPPTVTDRLFPDPAERQAGAPPTLTERLFPEPKDPIAEAAAPPAVPEVATQAAEITRAAETDALALPTAAELEAEFGSEFSRLMTEAREAADTPEFEAKYQALRDFKTTAPIEQAPMAEVISHEPASPVATEVPPSAGLPEAFEAGQIKIAADLRESQGGALNKPPKQGAQAAATKTATASSDEVLNSNSFITWDKSSRESTFVDSNKANNFLDSQNAHVVEKNGRYFAVPAKVNAGATTGYLDSLLDVTNNTGDVFLNPKDRTALIPAEVRPRGDGSWELVKKGTITYGKPTIAGHLRVAPEVARLIEEPDAQTGPQMKPPQEAPEGGALFGKGGTTPQVKPKGATPRGDTEFLRIEPPLKRVFKGLEREGAGDVIGHTKNKVGQMLSQATRKHVDLEQELFGQLSTEFQSAMKGIPKATAEKAFDEVAPYLAAKENGRALPTLSAEAQKLVNAWENIAEQTGQISTANGVQVFDPTTGAHRPMHAIGRDYVPRMLKDEVEQVMRDPERNPALWNNLVDDFATQKGITPDAAAQELRGESGRFASNDFMGNLEMARVGKLPESFYEYDLRNLASRYIPSFSERMAQIISYGQRLGPRESPQRPNLWDVARKEAADTYTQEWLNTAENQATNLKVRGASSTGMARAQTLASGLLLSNPFTTVPRNLLSGIAATPELLGVRRSIQGFVDTVIHPQQARMTASEIGAVRENIGDFLHADRLGDSLVDDAIRTTVNAGLKFSGYNGSEVFVRSHGALTASQFAKDGIAAILKNPNSMRAKEALGLFKRLGADAQKIVDEGADWKSGPETRKFIRTVIRETQGGYRFDQVPLWANSNMGRFFYQFGRWGTQRSRNIWNNGIKPALGEKVQWNGKTMTRRDVRPLMKMAVTTVALGETFAGIAQVLFGRDRRDASLSEISAAWDEDKKTAVALAMERVVNDVIMAGTLGIWSQPVDWAKGLKDQSRLKNPTEPPGLGSVRALADLGQNALDQGTLTRRDLVNFSGSLVPGVKQATDVARNVFDEPLYEAENDVKTLRSAAQRWAKGSGMDVAPRAKNNFRKSEKAPAYEPIKEALLVGNAEHAKYLVKTYLDSQPDRKAALKSLTASVKQSQPFRAGPYTAAEHRKDFDAWAKKNLSTADYQQTVRVQERYVKAAKHARLW